MRTTSGHRTISGQLLHVTDQSRTCADKMSGRKRPFCSDEVTPQKKRRVTVETVHKWIKESDREFSTSAWLKYDKVDREYVAMLKCSVCNEFNDKLIGMRNYNPAFVVGTKNLRASSYKDHAATDMHKRAMLLFKKQRGSDVTEYAPIAKALHTLDADAELKVKRKFDIAYLIAKENLAFNKMGPLCELEERHGVDLGQGYKNDQACATFVDYIAKEQQEILVHALTAARFFSLQADGSTDAGNVENELFLALYFDPYASDGKVHVRNKFLSVRRPKSGCAEGLFECLEKAVGHVGIADSDWKDKLIGFGCDGTSVNIAAGGLKGYLEQSVPWVVVFWCLAHRLELSLKDALSSTLFSSIDNMLMRLYYLYEKSPKKCRELEDVVAELRMCLEATHMPTSATGGNRPLRACGTRFVAHKVAALERVVNRFGAYHNHLTNLSEDRTVKSVDRQKLKGYLLQWQRAKMLLGCAFFHDLLKPAAILCKTLQADDVCVVEAIEAILKTSKQIEKLASSSFDDLPTVKTVSSRIVHNADGSTNYQEASLTRYEEGISFIRSHRTEYITAVLACLKDRVKAQSTDLLTHALTILAPKGWEKTEDASFAYEALDALSARFRVPLEKAGVDCSLLREEWDDMIDYSKRYLNLVQVEYQILWWKLFNSIDAKKWVNILSLVELLFCLPMSNGHIERVFSQLKMIKTEKRNCLSEDRLDSLLRIVADAPPLSKWDASGAVGCWWNDKKRRSVKDLRAPPKKGSSSTSEDNAGDDDLHYTLALEDWESWIG